MSNTAFYFANPSNLVPSSLPTNFRKSVKKSAEAKKKFTKSKKSNRLVGGGFVGKSGVNIPLRSFESIIPKKLSAKVVKKSRSLKKLNKNKKSKSNKKTKSKKVRAKKSKVSIKNKKNSKKSSKRSNNGLLL